MPDIHDQLRMLEAIHVIRPLQLEPTLEYIFHHALLRDAAYASMLRLDRRRLHQSVGQALERAFADRDGEVIGVIAEHYRLGEDWEKAAEYLIRAGDAAVSGYSDIEARTYFEKAVEALSHLPETADQLRRVIESLLKLVHASIVAEAGEVSLARLTAAEAAALKLVVNSDLPEDKHLLAQVHFQLGHANLFTGQLESGMAYLSRVIEAATVLGDDVLAAHCANINGQMLALFGDMKAATSLLEQARDTFLKHGNTVEIIACQCSLGSALAARGRVHEGITQALAGLQVAIDHENLTGMAIGTIFLAEAEIAAGRVEESIPHIAEGLRLARLSQNPQYERNGLVTSAFAKLRLGWIDDAEADLLSAQAMDEMLGAEGLWAVFTHIMQAWVLLLRGHYSDAIGLLNAALQVSEGIGASWVSAWVYRLLGESIYRSDSDRWTEAEQHFKQSLTLYEQGDMRMDAARLHGLWGSLCRERGNRSDAEHHFEAARIVFAMAGAADELERLALLLD